MKKNKKLKSWKEIAAYLECGVRTAQRWEKKFDLPVYRMGEKCKVFAFPEELDQWQFKDVGEKVKDFKIKEDRSYKGA